MGRKAGRTITEFSSSHPQLDIGRRRSYRVATNRLSCSLGEVVALHCDATSDSGSLPLASRNAESNHSIAHVHAIDKRQEERMKWRSEWFLSPTGSPLPPASSSAGCCENESLQQQQQRQQLPVRPLSSRSQYSRPARRQSSRDSSSGC